MTSKVDYSSSTLPSRALDEEFERELRRLRTAQPPTEANVIGDQRVTTAEQIVRRDPSDPEHAVGAAYKATPEVVRRAVECAKASRRLWRTTPYTERIVVLRRARVRFEDNMVRLAAVVSAETGKTRLEAFGEAQEVLDMIEHYCSLLERNNGYATSLKSTPEEQNVDLLVPFGAFAVIAPFNFPVALAVNMTIGALLTGNTVVLKPSDRTPRATAFAARLLAEDLPAGVLNVIHGGADVGHELAASDVDGIAFTGSSHVGWALAATSSPSGLPRPVLAEMGGQNPAIVTVTADLDMAADGISRSAFGLSGQKCSSCRRVIVDDRVADDLVERLKQRSEALHVGDALDPAVSLGPVIDDAIAARIDSALEVARTEGRVVTGGRVRGERRNYYTPIVVTDLPRGHALTREELFAPFLTVIRVSGLDEALTEANAVEYGLSAGIYSAETQEVDRFLDEIEAGVLYVNRAAGATTGAWPGVQAFAGWKRSGSHSKGGLGNWYLPAFMREQSRTIVRS